MEFIYFAVIIFIIIIAVVVAISRWVFRINEIVSLLRQIRDARN